MMMYRGGILQVLLESFTKGPRGFPYVFIIAEKVTTLEPIYGPTFVTGARSGEYPYLTYLKGPPIGNSTIGNIYYNWLHLR